MNGHDGAAELIRSGGGILGIEFGSTRIKASLIANLKARKFERGASMITMQLAKNLFLVREKTLSRKFEEMILTDYLEGGDSLDDFLEQYPSVTREHAIAAIEEARISLVSQL